MTTKIKKISIFLVILLISLLSFFGVISINGFCGYKSGHMLKTQKKNLQIKEWDCHCIGFKRSIVSSYSEKEYCTGINLSTPKISKIFFPNTQYPTR